MGKSIIEFVPTESIYLEKDIKPASMLIPQWYKDASQIEAGATTYLDKNIPGNVHGTFKICSPFLDAITSGYTMVLSGDIEIDREEITRNPSFAWRTSGNLVSIHTDGSWRGMQFDSSYFQAAFKWNNFFGIKTPPGYSTLFIHPLNRLDLPFHTLSGVVDTDSYSHVPINFPFVLKDSFSGILEAGTPLVQLIPFKRENWQHTYSEYNEKEMQAAHHKLYTKIKRSYKKQFWHKKVYQ